MATTINNNEILPKKNRAKPEKKNRSAEGGEKRGIKTTAP